MGTQNILPGKRKKTNRKKKKGIKKVYFECDIAQCFITGCKNLLRFKSVSLIICLFQYILWMFELCRQFISFLQLFLK